MKEQYNEKELVPVRMGEKFGYINLNGEMVIPAQFDGAIWFCEGLARVEMKEKYGFINERGDIVIPCKFETADNFCGGYCCVSLAEGRKGLIDRNGAFVIAPTYYFLWHYGEGVCEAEDKNYRRGLVSPQGVIAALQFDDVHKIGNAYMLVLNGKKGLANNKGIAVFPRYDNISGYFTDDIFEVYCDDKFGLIDINGEIVAPISYESEFMTPYGRPWAYAFLDGHRVFFDGNGKQIWKE